MSEAMLIRTNPENSKEIPENYELAYLANFEASGILQFAQSIFQSGLDELMAKQYVREPEGKGAHFDDYWNLLSPSDQHIAIYNISGESLVTTCALPSKLGEVYNGEFANLDERAKDARRNLSRLALSFSDVEIFAGTLLPGTGLVIPQSRDLPYVVHDITPEDPMNPGEFVKLLAPSGHHTSRETLLDEGFLDFDTFVTSSIANNAHGLRGSSPIPAGAFDGGAHDRESRSTRGTGLLD